MRKYKISITQKICLAGIFIVLDAILQKSIPSPAFLPFLRISIGGPALVIFSSILLGPWFGILIGAASDLFGYLIFDPKVLPPMFQITLIYALLGFSSYFVFKWISKIKKERISLIIEGVVFLAICLTVSLVVNLVPSITLYGNTFVFNLAARICVPIFSFILLTALLVATILINKHFNKKQYNVSVYMVSLSCFILEFVVMIIFGTAMKTWGFDMFYQATPFVYVLFTQLLVSLFNIPFNTIIISYLMVLSDKIVKEY